MTSQAENKEALKRVLNVIMPKYVFEFNGFMMNLVNLIQKNYSINDKINKDLETLPVTSQAPFPSIQLGQGPRRDSPTIGCV